MCDPIPNMSVKIAYPCTRKAVPYIIIMPEENPVRLAAEYHGTGNSFRLRKKRPPTSMITCRIAPAPMPNANAVQNGDIETPPTSVPKMAGPPATNANHRSLFMDMLSRQIGRAHV